MCSGRPSLPVLIRPVCTALPDATGGDSSQQFPSTSSRPVVGTSAASDPSPPQRHCHCTKKVRQAACPRSQGQEGAVFLRPKEHAWGSSSYGCHVNLWAPGMENRRGLTGVIWGKGNIILSSTQTLNQTESKQRFSLTYLQITDTSLFSLLTELLRQLNTKFFLNGQFPRLGTH